MWNGTMFVDLDGPLNASSLLSASAEPLVSFGIVEQQKYLAETAFLTFTDLLSLVISRTTLTYKNVKTKTKIPPKR